MLGSTTVPDLPRKTDKDNQMRLSEHCTRSKQFKYSGTGFGVPCTSVFHHARVVEAGSSGGTPDPTAGTTSSSSLLPPTPKLLAGSPVDCEDDGGGAISPMASSFGVF